MSNVEQGISNDEVKPLQFFPSAFVIRYSIFCGWFSASTQIAEKSQRKSLTFSRGDTLGRTL